MGDGNFPISLALIVSAAILGVFLFAAVVVGLFLLGAA